GESARLIEGAGTIGHEIGATLADVDYLFAPMGSGSLVAGVAIGLKGAQPRTKVIAVQSAGAPPLVHRPVCRLPPAPALTAVLRHVDDALLVSDRDLLAALNTLLAWGHVLVEPGAAAGLAGAWARRKELRGKRAVLVLSGANVDPEMIGRSLFVPALFDPT